jgi:ketosteroid isomerase-like protein
LACLSATSLRAQAPPPSVRREIQPLLDEEMAAANAHDTDRFLVTYVHDSTLVFVFNGVVTRGFTAVREGQLKAWNDGKSDVVYTLREPEAFTELSPNTVLVTELLSSRRTVASGEVRTADFVVSAIWQKRAEGWRVVYVHESTVR